MKKYLLNVLYGLDHFLNSLLGGSPDECLSTRAYDHYPRLAKIINLIFLNPNHCKNSAERENEEPGIII